LGRSEQGIKCKVESLVREYGIPGCRQDPFQLAKALGVPVRFFALGSLKGFYTVLNRQPFVVVHKDLDEILTEAVVAHELGHHVLHRTDAEDLLLTDYDLYRRTGRLEYEANVFACHLLIDDGALSAALTGGRTEDQLTLPGLAAEFRVPPELLQLKLVLSGLELEKPAAGFLGRGPFPGQQ